MNFRNIIATASAFGLLACGGAWAQTQGPNSSQRPDANQEPTSAMTPHRRVSTAKSKHWTGDLVDAGCMAKASSDVAPSVGPGSRSPEAPPNVQPSPPLGPNPGPEAGVAPGTPNPTREGSIEHGPVQSPDHNPDMAQSPPSVDTTTNARMRQEARMRDQARKCAATSATTSFGLVLGSGELMKFDSEGNSKASDEMKEVAVRPGKPVKARVTGTKESGDTLNVASVEVRGKHPGSSPAARPSGR